MAHSSCWGLAFPQKLPGGASKDILAVAGKCLPKSVGTNFTRITFFSLKLSAEAPDNFLQDISEMMKDISPSELQESALRKL